MSDLIDRKYAIETIEINKRINKHNNQMLLADEDAIIDWLNKLPSAERTGHWENAQYPFSKCSKCGAYMDTVNNEANYCCVCGSRNEVEHE